jgi:DNA-binding transcriptional ArsR family regulator
MFRLRYATGQPAGARGGPDGLDVRPGTCYVFLAGAKKGAMDTTDMTGDDLLRMLATLANPHRLRVVSALARERNYVSRLARDLGISRALLQVHLRKLEAAGLVSATVEVSEDGKAMKFYEVTPFSLHLTPAAIMTATRTLGAASDVEADVR